ncbi:MAG: flagellar hook-basal body protein [Oscillospiraceae bacterium]|jgi:flagellar basal-body rod protein FlgG|nr:flagellar hook-basal body protein [Oscillospiraceae bacterium]
MLRGLYTAGTAMMAQNRRMDVITNNIVNMETAGYKADSMVTQSFRDMMISRLNDPSVYRYSYVGPHNTGIHIDTIKTSFSQGPLMETNHTTDLALDGDAFFVVEYTPRTLVPPTREDLADPDYEPEYEYGDEEERYTRAGNFAVDAEGYLVTPGGLYVLGQGGRIWVGTVDFQVDSAGTVYVNGEEADTLRLARFEDNGVLRKEGANLFYAQQGLTDEDGEELDIEPEEVTVTVKQGFLEGSNVDAARETVRMMEAYRHYEINQRIVQIFDEVLGRSVNEIAKF